MHPITFPPKSDLLVLSSQVSTKAPMTLLVFLAFCISHHSHLYLLLHYFHLNFNPCTQFKSQHVVLEEFSALLAKDIWKLVHIPSDDKLVDCKWVSHLPLKQPIELW